MEDMSSYVVVRDDGYVNATLLCTKATRQVAQFLRLASTKKFVDVVAKDENIVSSQLIHVKNGSREGTWVHPRVATHLAQWISVAFAAKVTKWLETAKARISAIKVEYDQALEDLKEDASDQVEREVRQRLAKEVGGRQCVIGMHGEIDIVSPTEVIEVKKASKYLHALGQVMGHVESYPEKSMRVHLFGSLEELEKHDNARMLFAKHGVSLTFEIV